VREAHLTTPDAEADERRLIEAAQKDPRRFAELYEAHFARVYAYAARRLRDRQEAEDVTSEVFQQALASLPRFEWRGVPIAAWLVRIARNAIADRFERRERERGTPAPEPSVEPRLEDVEQQARLFGLVSRLPEDQRRVIEMRFVEQKSIRDIAAELGRSEGAVKQLQFRGLSELRERMGQSNA
jgi:RNA polymerase sigma-70 factor (ECF subfamily)